MRTADSADAAAWLLAQPVDSWSLVRFGPPGYPCHLRIPFRFDEEGDDRAVGAVFDVLAEHTATPAHCYAAVWEGWTSQGPTPAAPQVPVPDRTMLLFETGVVSLSRAPALAWGHDGIDVPPHWAWPADREWFFACDVDEEIEFSVGCGQRAATALEAALPGQVRRTAYAAFAPLYRES